jgi:hypothetical protein
MTFTLENIVPWGRSLDEYIKMFHLTEDDLHLNILGCGDGPASFNSEMHKLGYCVTSIDPVYQLTVAQMRERITATYDQIMEQVRHNEGQFVWEIFTSPEELGQTRMAAMQEFLTDFEQGKEEGRYLSEAFPFLPFLDETFDIALCSHLLFLYSEQLSLDFHRASIAEMCRVAREVRIFPLLDLRVGKSRYVAPVVSGLKEQGYVVEIETVPYEFQRGGNQMMRIRRENYE